MGVLSAQERDTAADPVLAAEIDRLSGEFSPLLLDAPEVEPPPYIFERIRAKIAAIPKADAMALAGSRIVTWCAPACAIRSAARVAAACCR